MMDYLRLIDDAVSFIEIHPLAGSPMISKMHTRRVKLTSHKQYQIHYDFDEPAGNATIVAVFK